MMRSLDVRYSFGDRVRIPSESASGTVKGILAHGAGDDWIRYLVTMDQTPMAHLFPHGWYLAGELEPLVIDGQELAP